jgi:hypothetical protein
MGTSGQKRLAFLIVQCSESVQSLFFPYLVKGQQLAITGELVQDRWEQDGVKRSRVKVNVADIQLLGKANKGMTDDVSF